MTDVDHDVIVIGAGFSGIGAAIKLDEAGFPDYLVLEKGDGVGGAWHFNTYPGVAVDIPSFSYSYSFERNPDWSRVYAPGVELKAYAEHCVDKYGLRDRIRTNTEVRALEFDERDATWTIRTTKGAALRARYVITAAGLLSQPKKPDIPGVDDFAGITMHTARWDHAQDIGGKRVGVIGTGASALQLVPAIAPDVEHLTVFQRTPIWVLPKMDAALKPAARSLLRRVSVTSTPARLLAHGFVEASFVLAAQYYATLPWLIKSGERTGRKHLRKQVRNPEVREKLTPRYGLGCKRPSFSNTYLATFNRPNVALETTSIERITPAGVLTTDGVEHELDVLVLATGFKVFESGNIPPYEVCGVGGLDLEKWFDANRFQAYHGVSVPAFPNLFSILGPYGFNGTSYFQLIENQMRHIVRCLATARDRDADRIEVRAEANDRYFQDMLGRRHRQVFFNNNCADANSYYFDKHGDVPFRSATSFEAYWQSNHFSIEDYRFERANGR